MVDEILVQRDAVRRLPDMDPRHILLQHGAALLQKQNVGGHLGARVGFKGRVGQAHRADQITARCQITAHLLALFVQRAGGRDEPHHAAHAQLIHGFYQKIVVDLKMQLIIPSVADLILPERHIADGKVKETVGQVGFFVPCDLDSRFLVQLFGDAPRHTVQLNAVEFGIVGVKFTVPMPKERPHAHTGFQHVAAHAADAFQSAVHGMNNGGRGVKGGQGRFPRSGIFVLGQKGFQLFVLGVPVVLAGVKGIGQITPAEIPRQNVLFGFGGRRAALLDGFQGLNRFHIGSKLFFRTFGHGRFIGCQIVSQVILGRLRCRGQSLHIRHHFGHKGAFCRLALLNFVAIHFHQGVKFQRGQQVAVHGFQRGKGFLRVEGVIHQFADGAAFQIRADLNGVLLVLGGGVAQIDLREIRKVGICDVKLISEVIRNVGKRLFQLVGITVDSRHFRQHHAAVAGFCVQQRLQLFAADGAADQREIFVPQMHIEFADVLHREPLSVFQIDHTALGAYGLDFRLNDRARGLFFLLLRQPDGILFFFLRRQIALHFQQVGNALRGFFPLEFAFKPPVRAGHCQRQPRRAVPDPAVPAVLVIPGSTAAAVFFFQEFGVIAPLFGKVPIDAQLALLEPAAVCNSKVYFLIGDMAAVVPDWRVFHRTVYGALLFFLAAQLVVCQ